jgi:hypothetical protein
MPPKNAGGTEFAVAAVSETNVPSPASRDSLCDYAPMASGLTLTLLLVLIAVLIGASLLCFWVGSPGPEVLKSRLDAMAPGGVAHDFPMARVAAMRGRALFGAVLALIMAAALWGMRDRFYMLCRSAGSSLREALKWTAVEGRMIAPQIVAVTVLGGVLRGFFLSQPIRVDEATTYLEFVSKPILYGLSYYPAPNNHIFHTLLAHFATLFLGSEPWALRLVAFMAGVAMIPAAALAAIAIKGREAALPAAALVGVCWPWIFYSANARGYTLAGLIFLILIPVCVRLRMRKDIGAWVWFVVLAGLGLFAVPVMAYAIVPLGVWIATSRGAAWRELSVATAGTLAWTLLLYAPAFTASGFTAALTPEMTPTQDHALLTRVLQFASALFSNWTLDVPLWASIILLCAAVIGWRSGLLTAIGIAWFIVALATYPVMPYTRVWLWLSLPCLLLIASGMGTVLPRRPITDVLLLALVALQGVRIIWSGSILRAQETGAFPDAAQVVRLLKQRWQPGDGLETDGVNWPLLYEWRRQGLPEPARPILRTWVVSEHPPHENAPSTVHLSGCWIWAVERTSSVAP